MNRLALWKKLRGWVAADPARQMLELGLSLLVGLLLGALIVLAQGFSSSWQGFIVMITVASVVVMLVDDLDKVVLAAIAIGVPLSLDVSLIISPYSRNEVNLVRQHRTLIALTELRVSLVLVILVIGYALWVIRSRESGHRPARSFASTSIPALGLVFVSLLSMLRAQDLQLFSFRAVQLIELFLAYYYLANHLRTTENMEYFVAVSVWAMLGENILMIIQWITGLEFIIAGVEALTLGPGRVGGTFGNPGPAAGYVSAQALIACAMIWAFSKTSLKRLALITFGTGVIALIGTGSRIGWSAFGITMPIFVLLGISRGWIKRETLIVLFVGALILGIAFFGTIQARYTEDDRGSTESRTKMFRLAWNVIRANPWLGVGAGNYALVSRDYYTYDVGDPRDVFDIQVHNRYLLIWAESGIFGLIFYTSFLILSIVNAWRCIRSENKLISLLGMATGLAIVSLCIQMFTATFLVRSITLFVWMLPALAASLLGIEKADSSHEHTSQPQHEPVPLYR